MNTLRSIVLVSLMPVLFFFGSEEPMLKEARIDMRVGHYHLAAVRLEQLLKEYPESSHCKEMLLLIVNAYARTQREKEAVAHLRTLLQKFPEATATLDSKLLKLVPLLSATKSDVPASVQIEAPSLPIHPMEGLSSTAAPPSSVPPTAFVEATLYTVQKPANQTTTPNTVLITLPENVKTVTTSAIRSPESAEVRYGETTPDQPVQEQPIRIEVSSVAPGLPDVASVPSAPAVLPTPALQKELPPIEQRTSTASVVSNTPTADTISFSTALQVLPVKVPPPALSVTASDSEINVKGDHVLVLGDTIHRHKMTVLLKRLRAVGLKPLVSKGERDVVMYRLVAACFDKSPAAMALQRELIGSGTKPFIFREGNSVCAAAGSFVDMKNAERLRKNLAKKGITTHIAENKMVLFTWRITVGIFPDILTAEEAMRRLALKGFEAAVEPL